MCDVLSATVREHLDLKTLRLVDASWPFVYWNFFRFYIFLYRVVNEWRNKSLSLSQVRNIHLPGRMILPRSFIPSDKYFLKNLTFVATQINLSKVVTSYCKLQKTYTILNISSIREALPKLYFFMKIIR